MGAPRRGRPPWFSLGGVHPRACAGVWSVCMRVRLFDAVVEFGEEARHVALAIAHGEARAPPPRREKND